MGTYDYYASMANNLNNPNATVEEIEGWFQQTNPSVSDWKPVYVDVTKPTLKSNEQLLDEFGLDKSKYSLESMRKELDTQSYKAYDNLNSSLYESRHNANVSAAESYKSLSDTINAKYSQGVDLGINRAMDQTNLLSTMLGTSQHNQRTIQNIDNQLSSSQAKLKESLIGNEQAAHETYDSLYDYLSKTAEQLYKEDVKRQEAEENYNKVVAEKDELNRVINGVTDIRYAGAVSTLASSIYKNNQSKKALVNKAALLAETADKLNEAYLEKARRNANATINSAGIHGYTAIATQVNLGFNIAEVLGRITSDQAFDTYTKTYQELIATMNS